MSVYIAGTTPALKYAAEELLERGISVSDCAGWQIEDVLLDVPSFRPGGLKPEILDTLLTSLPRKVRIWGGNLEVSDYRCIDLLKDETYLWENAALTAQSTLTLAPMLQRNWPKQAVLIIGWGRIGTYLAKILSEKGAAVTVAVRKEMQLLRLRALGYRAIILQSPDALLSGFDIVINTVPHPVISAEALSADCLKIDLASQQGIAGENVIWARGLPGIHVPMESGKLIAQTFLRLRKEYEK